MTQDPSKTPKEQSDRAWSKVESMASQAERTGDFYQRYEQALQAYRIAQTQYHESEVEKLCENG